MKNALYIGALALALTACDKKTVEPKVDEPVVEESKKELPTICDKVEFKEGEYRAMVKNRKVKFEVSGEDICSLWLNRTDPFDSLLVSNWRCDKTINYVGLSSTGDAWNEEELKALGIYPDLQDLMHEAMQYACLKNMIDTRKHQEFIDIVKKYK